MTRPLQPRVTLLSSCLVGNAGLTLWGTLERPGRAARGPAQGLFVDRKLMLPPLAGQRYCPAISGAALDSGPT